MFDIHDSQITEGHQALLVSILGECSAEEAFYRLEHGSQAVCKASGHKPSGKQVRHSPEEIARMAEMRAQGMSWSDIGMKFRASGNAIKYKVKRLWEREGTTPAAAH